MNLFYLYLSTAQAITISGTVLSEQESVLFSEVYLFNQQAQYQSTSVDSDGRFSFTDASGEGFRLFVVTPTTSNAVPKYYPDHPSYCDATPIYTTEDQELSFALPQGLEISGRVLLNSSPESDALLMAQPLDSNMGQLRGGFSDQDGFFTIKGLPSDMELNIAIDVDGLPEQWLGTTYEQEDTPVLDLSENTDLGAIELLEGIYLGGLIHSGSTIIPDALVTVYSSSQITSTRSDENGEFWLSGLPPGDVLAWAEMDGFATTYSPDSDRPTEFVPVLGEGSELLQLDIDAPIESTMSIQLLDAFTEEPILGASVLLYNDTRTVGRGKPVDELGVATVVGLHQGLYTLQYYAENDGYYTDFYHDNFGDDIWIEIGEGQAHELTIYLDPSENLVGEVVDERGEPVAGFSIILQQGEELERSSSQADGSFQVFGLNDASWTILAQYNAPCPNDLSYILAPNNPTDVNPTMDQDIIIEVYRDHDQDQMPSWWEEEWGLDPWTNDAELDADQDGVSNLQEYLQGKNPNDPTDQPPIKECGCSKSQSSLLIIPFLLIGRRRRG